ncbi:MAG: carboxypeptidase regulatory-like domain-containing protein, partial [Williamsia herbipolensis]|nr:carboxypeptidase regulatory-like domain-containing protein [Williamsia herbipolensis]
QRLLAAGGAPLADTSVSVTRTGREYDYREATTDADGTFDIGSLPAGRYQVCADTSDGPSGADGLGYAGRCLKQPLRVVDGATTTRTVTLAVGAALSGTVRSTAGTPVSGAEILVEGSRRGYYGYGFATTDSRGHWSVAGLATGDYRVCAQMEEARAKRMPTGLRNTCYDQHSKVHVTQGRRRIGVDLTTGAGGAISGRVLRSDGRPVRSVLVDAETMRGTDFGEAVTDADGHYRAVGMAPGTYRVCFDIVFVTGPDREKCVKDVQVRAGATTREVDVTYPAAGALEVSAVDTDGVPLAGADAAVLSPCTRVCSSPEPLGESAAVRASAVTDSRGSVLIRNLVPGKYWVCVFGYYAATSEGAPATGYADTCAARKVTITGHHRATSTLTLDVAGAVSGTVTDTSGDPIPGVHVEVSGSAEQDTATTDPFYVDGGPDAGATTGADGSYLVRSVVPGRQKVCFDATEATGTSAGGYESTCPDGVPGDANRVPVQVHTGAVTSGVDAELTPDGAITGRLTTSDGGRLGWFADAVAFSRGLEYDAIVGHKGNFTFDGLPAGKYRVCFQALHYRSQCYDDVPWSHRLPPENAKAIAVTAGDATTGIDATLVRR